MIALSDIDKHFADNHVLRGVSVRVEQGSVTALIGLRAAARAPCCAA